MRISLGHPVDVDVLLTSESEHPRNLLPHDVPRMLASHGCLPDVPDHDVGRTFRIVISQGHSAGHHPKDLLQSTIPRTFCETQSQERFGLG